MVCNNQTVTEFLGDVAKLDELIKNNDCVLEVEETKDLPGLKAALSALVLAEDFGQGIAMPHFGIV